MSAESSLNAAVADGVLIIESALRLTVRNQIIRQVMRHDGAITQEETERLVIRALHELASEASAGARSLRHMARAAGTKEGRGEHSSDYRSADVPALSHRAAVNETVAHRTLDLAAEAQYVARTAQTLLDGALREIVLQRLIPRDVPEMTASERRASMDDVRRDLRRQQRRGRGDRRRKNRSPS